MLPLRHQHVRDLPRPLPQHSGIRSRYFNLYFEVEVRGSAFAAILVLLLKTIPSSSYDALVCAKAVSSCARFMGNCSSKPEPQGQILTLAFRFDSSSS